MAKYRKKPVVIEAIQWDPNDPRGTSDFVDSTAVGAHPQNPRGKMSERVRGLIQTGQDLSIKTLEGTMLANPGDWIIRGVAGELYPCKPDIFAATYEPVDEGDTDETVAHQD